ncbi:hypothetical protein [Streptomyces cyaneofuscatus]|uniref:Uncharacterized protein n=1 Tax=Streptomyces cyaneofuscatus TaxID=66883 RepID=A0ABZ1EZU4_9ACTN|nr:hypothetical protein [Streptomyces cyaneofuscatus]WSB09538.1 hypothetical protein OG849_21030 [Streptomyces cyaneofuscatus]WSD46927.1 hypothetical protein OG857_14375 [Streptomyces cyaneofuscatus]
MTQSGQGGQGGEQQLPAGRPAHEGVVLPSDGGAPWIPGAPSGGQADQGGQPDGQAVPAGGQPWGQPWGPQSDAPAQPGAQAPGAYGYPQQQAPQQPQQHQQHQQQAQPLPPAQGQGQQYGQGQAPGYDPSYGQGSAGAYQQPQQSYQPQHSDPYQQYPSQQYQPQQPQQAHQPQQPQQPQPYAQPLPPEAGHGVPGGDADATQYIAPVPSGGGDADATQYIPPVPGGAPYGVRPGTPGAPDDRQPPAEFDNLFRAEGPAGATQQMPHQQYNQQQPQQSQPPAQPQPGYGYPGPGAGQVPPPYDGGGDAPRKRSAHIPLIAAVVVGCAVIGLGAGALLSGGDDPAKDDKQPVASQSSPPTTAPTTEAPADPAKPQAEALDKLLADSNNSRAAVISAVEKIKSCKDLDRANADLKGAAQQRRDLVTRLEGLTLDQLPRHEALNSSLTRAWKASAAADEHYATWARQAKKNKSVCKGGQARSTNETARANQQSGVATKAKQEASGLWNAIAGKYGLTKHTPVEL